MKSTGGPALCWSGRTPNFKDVMTVYTNVDATDGMPFSEVHQTEGGSLTIPPDQVSVDDTDG